MVKSVSLFIVFLIFPFELIAAVSQNFAELLTPEERAFLKTHPIIRISAQLNEPPFAFVKNGEITGYASDNVRLLAKKAGFEVEFVSGVAHELNTPPGTWVTGISFLKG